VRHACRTCACEHPTLRDVDVRAHRGGVIAALCVLASSAALSACSAGPHRDAVSATAVSFVSALERKDGAAACQLLTSDAHQSVSGATNIQCAKAILSVDEQGTTVRSVQVWGDAAQVRVGSDVLFLRRMSPGWRISAAGCQAQPKGPYDCEVGG
jgi:hypothetical protein